MELSPKVKICGITTKEQGIKIAEFGADALGFILYPKSPRYITPKEVFDIVQYLPPFTKTVGVFVNESIDDLTSIMKESRLDVAQLSGDESSEYCFELTKKGVNWLKCIRVKDKADLQAINAYHSNYILLDAWSKEEYGGTGKSFDWSLIQPERNEFKTILAGGISVDNVQEAIKAVRPYGIDVSSGVEERPGVKSLEKVKALLAKLR